MPDVRIEPWESGNTELLQALLGDPVMMEHLGGPEQADKIAVRQADYEQPGSRQYRVASGDAGVGWVGYWEREWGGLQVYEMGWSVLPAFQGQGIAGAAAAALLAHVRGENSRRSVHAFPAVNNAPSNAICRKLGFELLGPVDFEYDRGTIMRCNDWRFELLVDDASEHRAEERVP